MPLIDLQSDLLNYLADHHTEPGDRLPTLSELQQSDHLNISISKIREQLEVARAMGLVEVRSKTGMRLNAYSFAPSVRLGLFYALAMDIRNFEHIGSVRIHLETAYWREACGTLTDADIAAMRECIRIAREKLSAARYIQIPHKEHREFHLNVFKNLDNPFVTGLLEAYWDAYEAVELNRYADFSYHQQVWNYHERILDEIENGDFGAARVLFVEHTELLRVPPRMKGIAASEDS